MRDITLCHPRLQALTAQLVDKCVGAGLPIKIGESFRSVAEQDALYAQGRTQPGSIVTNARGSSYSSQYQNSQKRCSPILKKLRAAYAG